MQFRGLVNTHRHSSDVVVLIVTPDGAVTAPSAVHQEDPTPADTQDRAPVADLAQPVPRGNRCRVRSTCGRVAATRGPVRPRRSFMDSPSLGAWRGGIRQARSTQMKPRFRRYRRGRTCNCRTGWPVRRGLSRCTPLPKRRVALWAKREDRTDFQIFRSRSTGSRGA